jgi:two-component sensor histidine kinase
MVPHVSDGSSLQYAYRLEGVDQTWTELPRGNREIVYTNLDPGTYRVAMRGRYAESAWSDPTYMTVEVTPMWYERAIARAGAAALMIVLAIALVVTRELTTQRRAVRLERLVAERTEEIRVERDRVAHLNDRLESMVAERTRELVATNQRLTISNEDKAALLREVHHRVKNNMQIISSLLSLAEDHGGDPAAVINDSRQRIQSMAMIHEVLYSRSGDSSRVDFGVYINELAAGILTLYARSDISLSVDAPCGDIMLPMEQAVPCGLIVNEVVTNAFKHAFPGGMSGSIVLSLCAGENQYELTVADTGIGMPDGAELAQSTGMTIIHSLTMQLRGEVRWERNSSTKPRDDDSVTDTADPAADAAHSTTHRNTTSSDSSGPGTICHVCFPYAPSGTAT